MGQKVSTHQSLSQEPLTLSRDELFAEIERFNQSTMGSLSPNTRITTKDLVVTINLIKPQLSDLIKSYIDHPDERSDISMNRAMQNLSDAFWVTLMKGDIPVSLFLTIVGPTPTSILPMLSLGGTLDIRLSFTQLILDCIGLDFHSFSFSDLVAIFASILEMLLIEEDITAHPQIFLRLSKVFRSLSYSDLNAHNTLCEALETNDLSQIEVHLFYPIQMARHHLRLILRDHLNQNIPLSALDQDGPD
ncbi:hypothetical protein BLNAU_21033 [Blattamonas nauphoetae]|uniref:Uncharacterized protein n=1 Tax=Blattamonas nauphoetae TaxID=2049346 RepID=A0ABQ9WY23_9EUKA|nr:hypothetical protein BLNAU_21033 [Blattamonas nauphoetae]